MNEILDDQLSDPKGFNPQIKQRHGCVTAWLVLMIVANILSAISSVALSGSASEFFPGSSPMLFLILGLLGLANVAFAVMLFQWKKLGFFGFVGSAILALGLNMLIGVGVLQSLAGLIGIAVLYAILQIKNDRGVPAWELME